MPESPPDRERTPDDDAAPAGGERPILSYLSPLQQAGEAGGGGLQRNATVANCGSEAEAEMVSGVLADAGIPSHVVNATVSMAIGMYLGGSQIRVVVAIDDAERAAEVLRKNAVDADEMEPVDDTNSPPLLDEQGQPLQLATAGAFDSIRLLNEASTILSAARIRNFPPALAPRGDRPKGVGPRFVLRVLEDDGDRARSVLDDSAAEDEEENDPRCPKCKSWRVYKAGGLLADLGRLIGIGTSRPRPNPGDLECLACKYVGAKEEFLSRAAQRD